MPLFDLDMLHGQDMSIDTETGQMFDDNHQLIGSYNETTDTFHDANGGIDGFFNESNGQFFDQNHALEGSLRDTELGVQYVNAHGQVEATLTDQGYVLDSYNQVAGQIKKIW